MQEAEENLFDVVQGYKTEWASIKDYIPDADITEIYIVDGLKQFLGVKREVDAFGAIIEGNGYFKHAIGFDPHVRWLHDPEKMRALVQKYAKAAIIQKQNMPEDARKQMRKWEELFWKQEAEMMSAMKEQKSSTKADKFNQVANEITHRLQSEFVQAAVARHATPKQIGD